MWCLGLHCTPDDPPFLVFQILCAISGSIWFYVGLSKLHSCAAPSVKVFFVTQSIQPINDKWSVVCHKIFYPFQTSCILILTKKTNWMREYSQNVHLKCVTSDLLWSLASSKNCVVLTPRRPKSLSLSHSPGMFLTKSPVSTGQLLAGFRLLEFFTVKNWIWICVNIVWVWMEILTSKLRNSVHCQLCINHSAVPVSKTWVIICILSFLSIHQKSISNVVTLILMHQKLFGKQTIWTIFFSARVGGGRGVVCV